MDGGVRPASLARRALHEDQFAAPEPNLDLSRRGRRRDEHDVAWLAIGSARWDVGAVGDDQADAQVAANSDEVTGKKLLVLRYDDLQLLGGRALAALGRGYTGPVLSIWDGAGGGPRLLLEPPAATERLLRRRRAGRPGCFGGLGLSG
jgi:hypothetical protein